MKIAILTSHCPYNFGAHLQAFTTARYLKSLGHTPVVIDYDRKRREKIYRSKVPEVQWEAHDGFVTYKMPLSKNVNSKEGLKKLFLNDHFDGLIVGADAVWLWPDNMREIPAYFLDWFFELPLSKNVPAVSMSVANMGCTYKKQSKREKELVGSCLKKFTYITVRDEWTKKSINRYIFGGEKVITNINPDPVFVMDQLIGDIKLDRKNIIAEDQKYIICTFPPNSSGIRKWFDEFKGILNQKGYLVGLLPLPEGVADLEFDFVVPYPIDPLDWYLWLKNSSGFVGLRFHAVVCCITAGVPFISMDVYGLPSKFFIVLNKLGFYNVSKFFDKKSKIFQLLKGTDFRKNRVHSVKGINKLKPIKAVKMLIDTSKEDLKELRDLNSSVFKKNFENILNVFKNKN
ncbi:hypothetical protein CHISP_1550 [Chitinispirillum alkaliphilum]|nr:hypothetical protein CHISP_1550 [Chitinispirillum alkaliphilum]